MIGLFALMLVAASHAGNDVRDISVVRSSIARSVGEATVAGIRKREGGEAFLKKFFSDREWMEQFAGSGRPGTYFGQRKRTYADSLRALDLLVWNDKEGFIDTEIGRHIATALALDHGSDWSEEKLVLVMECYRDWAKNGTLNDSAWKLDTWGWRGVLCMGRNESLPVDDLRWMHDFASVSDGQYAGMFWSCCYRPYNCFGHHIHGPFYYRPWRHRWNLQQLHYRVGGVCGALSMFGSLSAASHGIPSFTVDQPRHWAYAVWNSNAARWGLGNNVTRHTGPHFTLGGGGWTALEEQSRYYLNPRRMDAEFLRWKGEYVAAMALVPGNWNAACDWIDEIKRAPSPEKWKHFGEGVRKTFVDDPCQGWQLYSRYLSSFGTNKVAKIEAARKGFLTFRENEAPTCEPMYYGERVLNPVFKIVGNDDDTIWALLPAMLDGLSASRNYYQQAVNWASERLMKTPETTERFLAAIGASAAKTKRVLDYRNMISQASQSEDIAMFRQVYQLMDKLSPKLAPKHSGKNHPNVAYRQELLSNDGLLKISTTCGADTPLAYRNVIDGAEYVADSGFCTDKEIAPWAEVILPGECEIHGVTIINSGDRKTSLFQVPLELSVSIDGEGFDTVWESEQARSEWKVKLASPVKARFVRVGRRPGAAKETFRLHKMLVYGRKLY